MQRSKRNICAHCSYDKKRHYKFCRLCNSNCPNLVVEPTSPKANALLKFSRKSAVNSPRASYEKAVQHFPPPEMKEASCTTNQQNPLKQKKPA